MASLVLSGRFKPFTGKFRMGKLPATVIITINWQTVAGNLGAFSAGTEIEPITLVAAASPSGTTAYTISSGALPTGLTLSSSGVISGTLNSALPESTVNFTVRASSDGFYADRVFSIGVMAAPEWVTPSGSLTSINLDEDFMSTVTVSSARDVDFEMVSAPENFTVEKV